MPDDAAAGSKRASPDAEPLGGNRHTGRLAGTPSSEAGSPLRRLSAFYALQYPNFRLFFVGQLISVAGTWMQTVAQQWLVYRLTGSPAWLGIVSGASAIPYVAFSLHGGTTADRYSRRLILLWTQSFAMLLAFLLAALASNRWIPIQPWHIAMLAAFGGAVNAYNMPAQQAFVSDLVDDRSALSNAIALNSLRFNMARFLGPILAGMTLVRGGAAACFFLNGLSFLAVLLSLLAIRLRPVQKVRTASSVWEGFLYLRRAKKSLRVILLVASASLFAWSVSTLFPVFADRFHVGAQGYSGLMSSNGVGAALGGLFIAAFASRLSRRSLVYLGAFCFACALLALSAVSHYVAGLVCLAVSGFCMIVFGISANTSVQEEVPDALRGRVMAVYSLVFQGLMPLGGLEIGFLAQHLGAVVAVRVNASIILCVTTALFLWSWSEQRAPESRLPLSAE